MPDICLPLPLLLPVNAPPSIDEGGLALLSLVC